MDFELVIAFSAQREECLYVLHVLLNVSLSPIVGE